MNTGEAQARASRVPLAPPGDAPGANREVAPPNGWGLLADARARLGREDVSTLAAFEQAYEKLHAERDSAGQLLTASYAVQTIAAAYADFRQAHRWVSRLRNMQGTVATLAPEHRLAVFAAIVSAAVIVDTTGFESRDIAFALEQALQLLGADLADVFADTVLSAARALLEYCEQQGQPDTIQRVVQAADRYAWDPAAGPLIAGRYWVYQARCRFRLGAYDPAKQQDAEAQALLTRADELGKRAGLAHLQFDARYARILLAAIRNDANALTQLVAQLHEVLDYSRPNCVALYYQHLSRVHLMHDEVALAFEAAKHALRAGELAACVAGERRSYQVMYALALLASGESERAIAQIDSLLPTVSGRPFAILECTKAFAQAWRARSAGSAHYRNALNAAFQQAQELNWPLFLNSLPRIAAQLAADALRFGIGVELSRRAIALRKLVPPADADDSWPWPVCIYALGRLEVRIEGKPLVFSGKAQRKPLELLKVAVVYGARGVGCGTIIEELWPDLEGPAARNAFDVALHRLRKLLKHESAVVMHDGKLALDPGRVWVDAWSFDLICAEIEAVESWSSSGSGATQSVAQRLLHCYRDHLLAGDDAHWALTARERLRSKLLRAAGSLGQALERDTQLDDAILLYRRAMELEPLAEDLHRRLMLCYRAQRRIAEALDAYRHCRDVLSITLGIEPSPATQAVYRSLRQQV